jgi:hypothetical protein
MGAFVIFVIFVILVVHLFFSGAASRTLSIGRHFSAPDFLHKAALF